MNELLRQAILSGEVWVVYWEDYSVQGAGGDQSWVDGDDVPDIVDHSAFQGMTCGFPIALDDKCVYLSSSIVAQNGCGPIEIIPLGQIVELQKLQRNYPDHEHFNGEFRGEYGVGSEDHRGDGQG